MNKFKNLKLEVKETIKDKWETIKDKWNIPVFVLEVSIIIILGKHFEIDFAILTYPLCFTLIAVVIGRALCSSLYRHGETLAEYTMVGNKQFQEELSRYYCVTKCCFGFLLLLPILTTLCIKEAPNLLILLSSIGAVFGGEAMERKQFESACTELENFKRDK